MHMVIPNRKFALAIIAILDRFEGFAIADQAVRDVKLDDHDASIYALVMDGGMEIHKVEDKWVLCDLGRPLAIR